MNFLEKLFGQKIIKTLILLIIGILLFIFGDKFADSKSIGIIIAVISLCFLVYEIQLRYYIKVKKNTKEFKSNREAFIAKYFDSKKIKYIYEKELKLGRSKLHPDFFLPEFDVYVEYWGKWPGDFDYRKECSHKRKLYEEYDVKLIELYPDNLISFQQLDWKFTERLLNILKKERS
ncbi:MAG TPA: hypothetical protein VJ461_00280 [Candidatus Nanoarchaeia archaeon]|nr:hypothetical protein [Candidatus Nanoarchaeia archaeon]